MQGIYGYKIDSRKDSIPLYPLPTKTATKIPSVTSTNIPSPTSQANVLVTDKYYSVGIVLLGGLLLL